MSEKQKFKYVIGIDEVGRGPLAGPVAVCAFGMPYNYKKKIFDGVRDSKKLPANVRERWAKLAKKMRKQNQCFYFICYSSSKIIDRKGLSRAIKSALHRALEKVFDKLKCDREECQVFLDGSLKAPENFKFQKTIIRGDDKIQVISMASVVAKVDRDKKMRRLAKKYPNYGFEIHKGYGTKFHYEKIKKHGLCEIHRRSFLKKIIN